MKRMLMAVMAIAVAVTFSAPSFAGDKDKKEEKKGKFVEMINADDMKKGDKKGGKADDTFGEKKEKPGK